MCSSACFKVPTGKTALLVATKIGIAVWNNTPVARLYIKTPGEAFKTMAIANTSFTGAEALMPSLAVSFAAGTEIKPSVTVTAADVLTGELLLLLIDA